MTSTFNKEKGNGTHSGKSNGECNMEKYVQELNERKTVLARAIASAKKTLSNSPDGALRISSCRGRACYYHITKSGDSHGRYIPVGNSDLVTRLAMKKYADRVLYEAECELKAVEKLLRTLQKHDAEAVYAKLCPSRKELVTPILRDEQERIRYWNSQPFNASTEYPEEKIYETRRGELVRSKSELIIADMYCELGIPYRYECEVKLKNGIVRYPDFTLYHAARRTVFYHEHLGLLDKEDYRERSMKKIRLYEANGISIGKNLLITWESEKYPFNIKSFREQIKELYGLN